MAVQRRELKRGSQVFSLVVVLSSRGKEQVMNRRFVVAAAFSVATLMCVVASAQPGGQRGQRGQQGIMRGPSRSMAMLLRNEAVREDVGITREQMAQISELGQTLRGAGGLTREDFQNLSQEERREKMREWMAQREKVEAELMKKVKEILDDKQMTRLEQIQLQASGIAMFRDPKVSEALKLTEDQRATMQESMRAMRQEVQDAFGSRDPEKVAQLRKKMMDKAMEVLTDDQKAALKKLTGKPFDVSKIQSGVGRRRRAG
jgi:hypothetical protein